MTNVIDAERRFARFRQLHGATADSSSSVYSRLRALSNVPHQDRVVWATRMGEFAARLSPQKPIEGAKRLFEEAWGGEKWQKRKRLIRLPGEEASSPDQYGSYEASGATWAALTLAAARLTNPHANSQTLEREQERVTRNMVLGTSLLPESFVLPTEVGHAADVLAELAVAIGKRIEANTQIENLWAILKVSPFKLEQRYPETEVKAEEVAMAAKVAGARWGEPEKGYFSTDSQWLSSDTFKWSLPFQRIGILRKRVDGFILVPPPEVRKAMRDLEYGDSSRADPDSAQRKIVEWLNDPTPMDDYNDYKSCGWLIMPVESTRSVYLQVCPRLGGVGLWLNVNESFKDNFIPVLDGVDLAKLAYDHFPPFSSFEPFEYEDEVLISHNEFGILKWPEWCKDLVNSRRVWRDGIIGARDTEILYTEDHAGNERRVLYTNEPPFGFDLNLQGSSTLEEDSNHYEPNGVGGWLDDMSNLELMSFLFSDPPGGSFTSLISGDPELDVPCRPGTVADALLRNICSAAEDRIDRSLTDQAMNFARAGAQFHERRMDCLRSNLRQFMD